MVLLRMSEEGTAIRKAQSRLDWERPEAEAGRGNFQQGRGAKGSNVPNVCVSDVLFLLLGIVYKDTSPAHACPM
jgi:hypothetical protein